MLDVNWIRTYGSKTTMSFQVGFMSEGRSGTSVPDLSVEVDDLDDALVQFKDGGFALEYGPVLKPTGCAASLFAIRLGDLSMFCLITTLKPPSSH